MVEKREKEMRMWYEKGDLLGIGNEYGNRNNDICGGAEGNLYAGE